MWTFGCDLFGVAVGLGAYPIWGTSPGIRIHYFACLEYLAISVTRVGWRMIGWLREPACVSRTTVVMRPRMIPGGGDEAVARSSGHRHAAEIGTVASTARGWHRVYAVYPLMSRAAPALFSLVLLVPSYAAAAENEDMAVLRRMLGELKAENRKLSERLSALEGTSAARRTKSAPAQERSAPTVIAAKPAPTVDSTPVAVPDPPPLPAPDLSET